MILVTGGTGMIGAYLLLECAKKKHPLRAIYRKKESLEYLKSFFEKMGPKGSKFFYEIDWVQTDLNDIYGLELAFKEVDIVYHCAAKVSLAYFHKEKLIKTNVEGTKNIVNLCIKHKVKKLGFVSSIASLGVDKSIKLVDESHTWANNKNHTPYAYSKYKAELEVWRGSEEGLKVIIINPGVILGTHFWKRSSRTILRRIYKGLLFYPTGKIAIVSIGDVVKSLMQLMDSTIYNERFILVEENFKQKTLLDKIAVGLKKKKTYFPLSKIILIFLFFLDKTLCFFRLKKLFMSIALIDVLCSQQEYDGSKITRKLPFNYSNSDKTLKKIFKTYLLEFNL